MSNKRIIGYLRVSGLGQEDGDGFQRQKEAISDFCMANGFDNIEYAREVGVTGTKTWSDRPMFAELIATWEQEPERKPYALVVERLDRLARDLMVQECALQDMKRLGIKVFSAENGMQDMTDSTSDPSRTLFRQLLGAIAQYDKSMLVQKLLIARKRIRDSGQKCEGPPRYGEKNLDERAVVNRMLSMAEAGASSRQIARVLEFEGVKARNGRPFSDGMVRAILRRNGRKLERAWYIADLSKLDCTKGQK